MNSDSVARAYASPLREEQLAQTRERILDGLLVAMKDGLSELSVPAVARAARVSVPTVYRHFRSKRALFEALSEHVLKKSGMAELGLPEDPDSLYRWVRQTFARLDVMDPTTAAAMFGALGGEFRRAKLLPPRLQALEKALGPTLAALPPDELIHFKNLAVVLTASGTLRTLKTYLGLDAEAAADTAIWGLRTLVEAVQHRHQPGGHSWTPPRKRRKRT